jgi:NADPH:quinone reductase-like Zn-dependent oxidoreductase
MRAIGYQRPLPITDDRSLIDIDLPKPSPSGHDLLVEVRAISVNPADTKIRANAKPDGDGWKVLGWDAAGVVADRPGGDGLQERRCRVLCRIDHAGRHLCRISPGR